MHKEVRKKLQASGKRLMQFSLPAEVVEQIDAAARSGGHTRASWLRMAIGAYLRRWSKPEPKAIWPTCSICGQKHNPADHYPNRREP